MTLSPLEFQRYCQQMKLDAVSWQGQIKLKQATVLCVGAGGLGCSLLLYLAGAGVGEIIIVDDDLVELSNLQRQILFQEKHIGQAKAFIAKSQLQALNSDIQISSYVERLTIQNAEKILVEADIIADCSDNFATRLLINEMSFRLDKPSIFASVSEFQGQCALFLGKDSPCFHCLFPSLPNCDEALSCQDAGVMGFVPGILGMLQSAEIIKWILSLGQGLSSQLLTVDLLNNAFHKVTFQKNPDCEYCSRF